MRTRRRVLGIALILAAALFTLAAVAARGPRTPTRTYRKGQRIYDAGRLEEALPYFREAQRLAPLSNTAVHSTYYESIILFREKDWAEAEKAFQRLLDHFPEAAAAAESLYHVGLCRARLGDARRGRTQRGSDTQTHLPRHAVGRLRGRAARGGWKGRRRLTPFTIGIPVYNEEAILVAEHRAAPRLPRWPRARVRGDHRLERLDRLDHDARRRSDPPLPTGHASSTCPERGVGHRLPRVRATGALPLPRVRRHGPVGRSLLRPTRSRCSRRTTSSSARRSSAIRSGP